MPDLIQLAVAVTPILFVVGWTAVILRAQEADRALAKARKEKRDRVCGCD